MNAVGYIRVSTLDQAREGVSLAAQEERIRAYCKMSGLHLVKVVREEGVSASIPLAERPGGKKLLESIKGGAGHVVALKLDRLFRDAVDALTQTKTWDREGVTLHLVDLGGSSMNTSSATGRLFLTLLAAMAEWERNMIGERTSLALAHKKSRGEPVGRTPFGFRIVGRGLFPVPDEQAIVEEIRRQRASGLTLREIAAQLEETGVPTQRGGRWSPSVIRRLINDQRHPTTMPGG